MANVTQMLDAVDRVMGRKGPTNRETAASNPTFRKACELAGIAPTKRQASKWARNVGTARNFRNQALAALKQERAG